MCVHDEAMSIHSLLPFLVSLLVAPRMVEEIYDVAVLPGVSQPIALGFKADPLTKQSHIQQSIFFLKLK